MYGPMWGITITMLKFLTAPFKEVYRCRAALLNTLNDEIRRKYAGSVFGMTWFVLMPMLFLVFYAAVYLVIFRVKPPNMSPLAYLHFIYIGLMAFLGFSEAMTTGAGSLVANRAIILNKVFPAELLPLRTVLATQTTFIVGFTLAVIWSFAAGRATPWLILVPIVMGFQIVYLIGLAWLLSPVYLVFRDLGQLLSFASLAIMVISPIAYRPTDLVGFQAILLYINPLYFFLSAYHAIIFDGQAPPLLEFMLGMTVSAFMFFAGYWFFSRVKSVIAEHV